MSGFDGFRGYTSEGKWSERRLETIGLGGTADQFLGEMIDRYRELMFRAARPGGFKAELEVMFSGCGETFIPAACLSTFTGAAGVTNPIQKRGKSHDNSSE